MECAESIDTNTDGIGSVSCPTAQFCVALDYDGNAISYDGTAWSAPESIDSASNYLDSVSCPSAVFCGAVDAVGNALTYSGAEGVAITSSSLPGGTVGQEYSTTLAATGGAMPYSWSKTGGTLPGGLTLGTDGVISGDPTTPGTSDVTVKVTDSSIPALTATASLSITVDATPKVVVTSTPLPATAGSVTYAVTVSGQSGTPTGTVTISDGDGGTCDVPTLSAGAGNCSVTESAAEAPLDVTASYSGDSTYASATTSLKLSSSVSVAGSATAGSNGVTASATGGSQDGIDTVTEAQYASDPVAPLANGNDYFDVAVSSGATFSAVGVDYCNSDVTPATYLEWWNSSAEFRGRCVGTSGEPSLKRHLPLRPDPRRQRQPTVCLGLARCELQPVEQCPAQWHGLRARFGHRPSSAQHRHGDSRQRRSNGDLLPSVVERRFSDHRLHGDLQWRPARLGHCEPDHRDRPHRRTDLHLRRGGHQCGGRQCLLGGVQFGDTARSGLPDLNAVAVAPRRLGDSLQRPAADLRSSYGDQDHLEEDGGATQEAHTELQRRPFGDSDDEGVSGPSRERHRLGVGNGEGGQGQDDGHQDVHPRHLLGPCGRGHRRAGSAVERRGGRLRP